MSYLIKKALAREILDSRGNPTVECDVFLRGGVMGRASVPSGASTGRHEAHELRDGGKRFHGLGVLTAVGHVNSIISRKVSGMDCRKQKELDDFLISLDDSSTKSLLGANAILAVSLASARAASSGLKLPLYQFLAGRKGRHVLPVPFCNVINGGKHAGSGLKLQEFMIVPVRFNTFRSAVVAVSEVYHELKALLLRRFGKSSINVGDEGGFAPQIATANQALSLLESAVATSGYTGRVKFAIDAAATEFYSNGKYELEDGKFFSSGQAADYYLNLAKSFPVISIEDPFEQESFSAFAELTKKLVPNVQVVGDDLTVTNVRRIAHAARLGSCNCLLVKVNQIGTLSEAISASNLALQSGWRVMVSHRSGETEDTFIADLAVGLGTGQIKLGAPARTDRTAKYNRLLRIEEELAGKCSYGVLK